MIEESPPNPENYLFFSHQYRLKNYLINPLKELAKKNEQKLDSGKFSNNMILCLTIQPTSSNSVNMTGGFPFLSNNKKNNENSEKVNIALNLIYGGDGEVNITNNKPLSVWPRDEVYWTTKTGTTETIEGKTYITKKFKEISFDVEKADFCNKFKIDSKDFTIDKVINLYFIRHGKAQHNEKKSGLTGFIEKHNLLNPRLIINDVTILNMKKASEKLVEHLKGAIKAVLVSDLIRTQTTAEYFLNELNNVPPIYVLPCLHENTTKDGSITFDKLGKENQTDCVANGKINRIRGDDDDVSAHTDCSKMTIHGTEIDINWTFYKTFYGEGYRFQYKPNRRQCRDTHFLGIFFEYKIKIDMDIYTNTSGWNEYASDNNNNNLLPIGYFQGNKGGKKRRQTKKHRVMKSKKVRRVKKHNKKSKKVKRRSNKRKA